VKFCASKLFAESRKKLSISTKISSPEFEALFSEKFAFKLLCCRDFSVKSRSGFISTKHTNKEINNTIRIIQNILKKGI
jgi:glutamate-1-semialdehyde aminotransferase